VADETRDQDRPGTGCSNAVHWHRCSTVPGQSFCNTDIAKTIQNVFTIIQFGGPLLGGVLALGATVGLPFVRRSDWKKELKEIRNQGLVWGVIAAPLGTQILSFILNNVVAGGTSCGF